MSDGHDERDEFDERLRRSIEPLPPPPGTYERVRRQARRRRLAKAVGMGAAAVVVVAAGVAVPRMMPTGRPEPIAPQTTGAQPFHTPTASPKPAHTATGHTTEARPSSGTPDDGTLSPLPSHRTEAPAAGPARCHTGDLSLRLTGSGAGAGQRYAGVVLTNTSERECTLFGYIGAGLLGKDGPMPTNLIRDEGPRDHLTVAPGESAATSLHWSAIPGTDEDTGCPDPTGIAVTPPDETTQLTTEWTSSGVCQHGELHTVPLVKGESPPPI